MFSLSFLIKLKRYWGRSALISLLLFQAVCSAHEVPQSEVLLDIGHSKIVAELHLPLSELRAALRLNEAQTAAELVQQGEIVREYIQKGFAIQGQDGQVFPQSELKLTAQTTHNENWTSNEWVFANVSFTVPASSSADSFKLEDRLITQRVVSHEIMVYVRHDIRNGIIGEQPVAIGLLDFSRQSMQVDGSSGSWIKGLWQFFKLGLHHIAEGSDHQLFLLVLLLSAPFASQAGRWKSQASLRKGISNVLWIVSGFTIGHSLTLFLGAMGWVLPMSAVVEPSIALTILVSCIHAIRPIFAGKELWVACGFGMIHGLAFSEALQGLNYDGLTLATSLLGFNLGIEAMQLLIVSMVLPWFFLLAQSPMSALARTGLSAIAAIIASSWLIQRLLHKPNFVSQWSDAVLSYPLRCLLVFVVLSLLAILSSGQLQVMLRLRAASPKNALQ